MPPTVTDFAAQITRIVDIAYIFGGLLFLVLIIIIGFIWMTGGNDDEKIAEARKRLGYWVVGFFLYFLSYAIVIFTFDLFQVKNCLGERPTPGFNLIQERSCPQVTTVSPGASCPTDTFKDITCKTNATPAQNVKVCIPQNMPDRANLTREDVGLDN